MVAAARWDGLLGRHSTSAGTLGPADALVLGSGVAGLEAIGTLVRLGVRVAAHDVRPSCAAEVASLGASYVAADEVADRVREADLLVTTARSVGQPVPLLVTAAQVAAMRPGSVVVDVAGGNVDGPVAWRGGPDAAAARPATASRLYSAHVAAFVALLTRDPDDEVVAACRT
nr:NAD(P)-dependent oxidoreductase [Nocardioides flavescens]